MRWNADNYEIDRGKGEANGRASNERSAFSPIGEAQGTGKKKNQQGRDERALNRRVLEKSAFYLALPGNVPPALEIQLPGYMFYCMSCVSAFV